MGQSAYEAYDSAGKRKYLTISEGKDFLRSAAEFDERERLLCEALHYLGCRPSELVQLTREDVESPDWVVRIRCLKKRGKVVVRRVPIPESLAKRLMALRDDPKARLWEISRMAAWRIVKRAMMNAGIAGIHACPKGLRHAFGVRAALAGVPVSVIQQWMGHSASPTTAIYLAVKDAEERQMMALTWHEKEDIPPPCYRAEPDEPRINVTIKIGEPLCREARHLAIDAGLSLSAWMAGLIHREARARRASVGSHS